MRFGGRTSYRLVNRGPELSRSRRQRSLSNNMMTSSNGSIFRVTGPLSPVNTPHTGQWSATMMFYLICAWKKRLNKQSGRWWFIGSSHSLWCHCNAYWNHEAARFMHRFVPSLWNLTGVSAADTRIVTPIVSASNVAEMSLEATENRLGASYVGCSWVIESFQVLCYIEP